MACRSRCCFSRNNIISIRITVTHLNRVYVHYGRLRVLWWGRGLHTWVLEFDPPPLWFTFVFSLSLPRSLRIDKQKIENETKVQTQRDSTIEVLEENLNLSLAKVRLHIIKIYFIILLIEMENRIVSVIKKYCYFASRFARLSFHRQKMQRPFIWNARNVCMKCWEASKIYSGNRFSHPPFVSAYAS